MSDLVKPSNEDRGQTNFQRASCTLDAGVKIYSYRVDSVHNSIYKTLGGLSRTAATSPQEEVDAGECACFRCCCTSSLPCSQAQSLSGNDALQLSCAGQMWMWVLPLCKHGRSAPCQTGRTHLVICMHTQSASQHSGAQIQASFQDRVVTTPA